MTRVLLALALSLGISAAIAAPKAQNARECQLYAELALVAAAAAKHGVERERLEAMLLEIYGFSEQELQVARAIVDVVYRTPDVAGSPQAFARLLGDTCVRTRGDMDSILGTRL